MKILTLVLESFARREYSGGSSKVVNSCSRMIRPPVVIGSAMLISAAAWSFGPWRVSVLIVLYGHYLYIQFTFRICTSECIHFLDDESCKEPSRVQGASTSY